MSWDEIICRLYDIKIVEDENHFLVGCHAYTHIRAQFQNICYNTDIPNLLTHHSYGDLGMFFLKLLEHRKKILKKTK